MLAFGGGGLLQCPFCLMPPLLGPGAPSDPAPVPTKYRTCIHTHRCLCIACTYNIHAHSFSLMCESPFCFLSLSFGFWCRVGSASSTLPGRFCPHRETVLKTGSLPGWGESTRSSILPFHYLPIHTPATGR